MTKKFLLSVVVVFVVAMAIGWVVHGLLLAQDYTKLSGLFRQPQEQTSLFWYIVLAHVLFAVAFVWIYVKGKEDRPFLMQGVRYGVALAVLMTLPVYLTYYAVQPLPGALVVKQIVLDTISVIILGVVVAWLNK